MKASGLMNVTLFSGLQESELEEIAAAAVVRRVPADTMILRADEEGDSLFVILSGRVSVSMHSEEGREVILSILTDGDFFGEISLLDGKPRSATVIATEPTDLLTLRRPDFLACLEKHPQIATHLLSTLAFRLRRTNRQVESLALLNAYGRVAGVLLQLAEDEGDLEGDENRITILERPILQEIANMAGTTRETVSRILNNLERRGYIHRDGRRITILDRERLQDDFFFHL
jgi:CRP/FNR family transcriptional regulator/CRP/FNR family cyclic AMP-dependent transcriptional regulator